MATAGKADAQKGDDEEIVIVEDESKLSGNLAKDTSQDSDSKDDQDDLDDDQDERVSAKSPAESDGNDPERDAIRERRRQEKVERKERRDAAIRRDKVEMEFLRKRNNDLERRVTAQEQRSQQAEIGGYDAQIAAANNEAEMAERVIAKAIEAGNGADVTQALKFRDKAVQKTQQLEQAKQQAKRQATQTDRSVDDHTMRYANEFIKENPWYDVHGRNEESAIVIAIDQGLSRDGYDPQTEEYWSELRKRASRRLPEKFKTGDQSKDERVPRGGPAVGSGREHASGNTRKEIYVSPERKQALIEAGVWDDPVLRVKYVKRYAEYDKANKA